MAPSQSALTLAAMLGDFNRITSIGYRIKQSDVRPKGSGKRCRVICIRRIKQKGTITYQPVSRDFSIVFSHTQTQTTTKSQAILLSGFFPLSQLHKDQLLTVKSIPTEPLTQESHLQLL